jgi:hypothetical protein
VAASDGTSPTSVTVTVDASSGATGYSILPLDHSGHHRVFGRHQHYDELHRQHRHRGRAVLLLRGCDERRREQCAQHTEQRLCGYAAVGWLALGFWRCQRHSGEPDERWYERLGEVAQLHPQGERRLADLESHSDRHGGGAELRQRSASDDLDATARRPRPEPTTSPATSSLASATASRSARPRTPRRARCSCTSVAGIPAADWSAHLSDGSAADFVNTAFSATRTVRRRVHVDLSCGFGGSTTGGAVDASFGCRQCDGAGRCARGFLGCAVCANERQCQRLEHRPPR